MSRSRHLRGRWLGGSCELPRDCNRQRSPSLESVRAPGPTRRAAEEPEMSLQRTVSAVVAGLALVGGLTLGASPASADDATTTTNTAVPVTTTTEVPATTTTAPN